MGLIFTLLFFTLFALIILAHSWGFWRVYQSRIDEPMGLQVFGRGVAAGFAGWFWLCFALGIWNWKAAAAWIIYAWIYGIFFVPAIGVALTLIFWYALRLFGWRLGFWSRALSGCAIGVITGSAIGLASASQSNYGGLNRGSAMALLFGTMGFVSGIMAGESDD